jgi:hypothetical protein
MTPKVLGLNIVTTLVNFPNCDLRLFEFALPSGKEPSIRGIGEAGIGPLEGIIIEESRLLVFFWAVYTYHSSGWISNIAINRVD